MIKVLLVDDHRIIRDGLKALLMGVKEINIIGECSDGIEVSTFLDNNNVDVILMDINMPKQDGITTTGIISKDYPNVKIIALTMHQEESYISKILQAGANGYVIKNASRREIVDAINKVNQGNTYFSEDVTNIMMSKYLNSGVKSERKNHNSTHDISIEDLTKRELEILNLIIDEHTNVEIGEKLFISPRTVDTHRRNLLLKIGVKNTAGLVKYALQHNLID
jgi:DNA-binding NarL/FixJ family response regulator